MIPFRVKKLTKTAKAPTQENAGDLWDLYVDDFCSKNIKNIGTCGTVKYKDPFVQDVFHYGDWKYFEAFVDSVSLNPRGRILVKTGISLELPKYYFYPKHFKFKSEFYWVYDDDELLNRYPECREFIKLIQYAVADIRPRSDNLEQKGLFIENKIITGGEVSFVAINHGHEPITISKGDVIAKMLICSAYPSKMEVVDI